jgi:hypothetical protein
MPFRHPTPTFRFCCTWFVSYAATVRRLIRSHSPRGTSTPHPPAETVAGLSTITLEAIPESLIESNPFILGPNPGAEASGAATESSGSWR